MAETKIRMLHRGQKASQALRTTQEMVANESARLAVVAQAVTRLERRFTALATKVSRMASDGRAVERRVRALEASPESKLAYDVGTLKTQVMLMDRNVTELGFKFRDWMDEKRE